jgi:site-specific DNA-methyltransferase (adenine-specific)
MIKILSIKTKKIHKQIKPEDIARLHFKNGECYSVMLWDSSLYFKDDFEIEFANATTNNVPSPSRQVETLVSARRYSVIYCDCPWKYDNEKDNDPAMGGMTYKTMSVDELCRLPVNNIAAKDCALFFWATMPKLREALKVIEAWGFEYRTCAFTWVKQNPKGEGIYSGLGHWTNGNAELCLFAKQGQPKRINKNVKQIVLAPRSRHSAKPAEVRERIVRLMGDIPRVELFAREKVDGWECFGNEVESTITLTATG